MPVRKGGNVAATQVGEEKKKASKTQKGTAATYFQTPKFWGWVKEVRKIVQYLDQFYPFILQHEGGFL